MTLTTGMECTASYAFREDGRLMIRCQDAYPPLTFLSPRCDIGIVHSYAETLLHHSLRMKGLL